MIKRIVLAIIHFFERKPVRDVQHFFVFDEIKTKYKSNEEFNFVFEAQSKLAKSFTNYLYPSKYNSTDPALDTKTYLLKFSDYKEKCISFLNNKKIPADLRAYILNYFLDFFLINKREQQEILSNFNDLDSIDSKFRDALKIKFPFTRNYVIGNIIENCPLGNVCTSDVNIIFFYSRLNSLCNPFFDVLSKLNKELKVSVLGVCVDENVENYKKYNVEMKLDFATMIDRGGFVSKSMLYFGNASLPSIFVLDSNGKVIANKVQHDYLMKFVMNLLEKQFA